MMGTERGGSAEASLIRARARELTGFRPTGRLQQRRSSDRRRKLLDAARAVFQQKGFAAKAIDDDIALTERSRGSITLNFGSKVDLFEAVVREESERFGRALAETLSARRWAPAASGYQRDYRRIVSDG